MFRHNLLFIYRNAKRSASTFLINLTGLSAGLAAALLICLWVMDEWNIDKFHEKDRQLFQVMMNISRPDGIETTTSTPAPVAKTLLDEVPEIENAVAAIQPPLQVRGIVSFEGRSVKAHQNFVGKAYFQMFSYKLIQGSRDHVLSDKNFVLISDNLAIKLFGTADNIAGKTLEWNGGQYTGTYTISGIFERVPENSTTQFDILFNFDLYLEKNPDWAGWSNRSGSTYVLLKDGADPTQVNQKIAGLLSSRDGGSKNMIFLRPYSDQHLYATYKNGVLAGGRIAYVKLFSTIAAFILVIACINFMNLSTARASRRIKEIGVRKAVGAARKTLISQHLGESQLMAFLALIVAVLVVDLLLPQFNTITEKHLTLNFNIPMLLSFCGIALLTGLISGSYPALYLSGFNPAIVLKGKLQRSAGEQWTRKGLVVFQFAISIILIVSVIVVWHQIAFIQSTNLGYKRDNILYFANEGPIRKNLESFLTELRKIPGVIDASNASFDLTGSHGSTYAIRWEGKTPEDSVSFINLEADFGIVEMLQLEMKAGRTFLKEAGDESSNIIINEAAAAIIGFQDPIGKTIKIWEKEKQIIGVVKNFHFESLYEAVKPCFIQWGTNKRNMLVKIHAGTEPETVSAIQHLYQEYNQGFPFEYRFLDQDYQKLYTSEKRVGTLAGYFAAIAIVISCLGLFALAAFTAEVRQKEIGIRKVLGSGEFSIVLLLSSDFTRTILTAIVIALPISYFIASEWLDHFALRAPLQCWYFIGAGTAALLIAWLTIGTQAIRAATINPIKYLKAE